jgi:hypothetical protein
MLTSLSWNIIGENLGRLLNFSPEPPNTYWGLKRNTKQGFDKKKNRGLFNANHWHKKETLGNNIKHAHTEQHP